MLCRVAELVSLLCRSADLIRLADKFAAFYCSVHHLSRRKFISKGVGMISIGNRSGEDDSVYVLLTSFLDVRRPGHQLCWRHLGK